MKISVIIPIYLIDDQVKWLTDTCINSLISYTQEDYELIIIDNNSPMEVNYECDVYVRNKQNMGNAVAWNQGLALARGDFLLLADNDVEFEPGWEKLTESTEEAIVFPATSLSEQLEPKQRLAGFFWMMNRDTFKKLGNISEEYGLAYYEDTDYFMRTRS